MYISIYTYEKGRIYYEGISTLNVLVLMKTSSGL